MSNKQQKVHSSRILLILVFWKILRLIRVLKQIVICHHSDHHYNVLDGTSTLYTVARGLLRLLRLRVLVHNLGGPSIAGSDFRGLAEFSETDLQHRL